MAAAASGRQDRQTQAKSIVQRLAGRSLPAAEARCSYPNCVPCRLCSPNFVILNSELRPWGCSSPQPPIAAEMVAGKIGRAATGSPQPPPPGGGLLLMVAGPSARLQGCLGWKSIARRLAGRSLRRRRPAVRVLQVRSRGSFAGCAPRQNEWRGRRTK